MRHGACAIIRPRLLPRGRGQRPRSPHAERERYYDLRIMPSGFDWANATRPAARRTKCFNTSWPGPPPLRAAQPLRSRRRGESPTTAAVGLAWLGFARRESLVVTHLACRRGKPYVPPKRPQSTSTTSSYAFLMNMCSTGVARSGDRPGNHAQHPISNHRKLRFFQHATRRRRHADRCRCSAISTACESKS